MVDDQAAEESPSTLDNGDHPQPPPPPTSQPPSADPATRADDHIPRAGMTFKTRGEASEFYKQYARSAGFGAIVRNPLHDARGEVFKLACSKCRKHRGKSEAAKTNCPASVRFRFREDGSLNLVRARLKHNHPLDPEMKLTRGDGEAVNDFFARMQTENASFFYSVDFDDEGRMRNVFWADPLSRAAYQYFGDVVSIDTTRFINRGDTNVVLFLGVNHHGRPVLLGCGLVSDETTETFAWLFKAWLACVSGRPPSAIVTHQNRTIQEAVALVFPGARHRLCLGYMTGKTMEKIRSKVRVINEKDELRNTFKKVVHDSLSGDEFDKDWQDMVEKFGLHTSEWFNLSYENRHSWVPVFLKDAFWAGICNTQCCRTMSKFFDDSVHSDTSLSEFVEIYETTLESKYKKEAQADYESVHKFIPLVSKFYMEVQMSKLYTTSIFWRFQNELKATIYCDVSLLKEDGLVSTCNVKESVFLEDSSETVIKEYEVLYHANEAGVQCICGSFKLQGILCRHALSVLKLQQMYEIPAQYILSRWRKDYKQYHALSRNSNYFLANNLLERYGHLSKRCLQLVDMGAMSDEKYQLALALIEQVEKHMLDETRTWNGQQKSFRNNSRLSEANESHPLSQPCISTGDNIGGSSQVKRRNIPPKKRKEPISEAINGSNNDPPIAPLTGNQDLLRLVAAKSHLGGSSITQGGINLMEDVNANGMAFGNHFGGNTQHYISNQFGMQFNNATQARFEQQSIGNSSMSWLYQRVPQEDNLPRAPLG